MNLSNHTNPGVILREGGGSISKPTQLSKWIPRTSRGITIVLMLAILILQSTAAQACIAGVTPPTPIENPEGAIKDAYFIGVVEVVAIKDIPNSGFDKIFTVRPIHTYKASPAYKEKEMKVEGRQTGSMCDRNTKLWKGSYVEVIIFREEKNSEPKKWWQRIGRPKNYKVTTHTLEKYWPDLRKDVYQSDLIRQRKESCEDGYRWSAEDLESTRTLKFDCYKAGKDYQ